MSIFVVFILLVVAVVWLGGCFFTRRTHPRKWPLWLGVVVVVVCILLLGCFHAFHETRPLRKEVIEETTLDMTSTGNDDHCLVMRDGKFYFSYVDYNKLKKGEAEVEDSSVSYNPNENKVIVRTTRITEKQHLLFLYYEKTKIKVEYAFYIPSRNDAWFDFENR